MTKRLITLTVLFLCSCKVTHRWGEGLHETSPSAACARVDGASVSSSDPMFDTTAEALLAGAEHTATGPGWSELVLPDIEEDFTVRHAFTFLSAYEAEFEGPGGYGNTRCPEGDGFVIEAEQSIVFSFGNQAVEGTNHVRFFIGEEDPEALTGELVEKLTVDVPQDVLDATEALHGAPACGPDEYNLEPFPTSYLWVEESREGALWILRDQDCDDAGMLAASVLARMEDGSQATSATTGDTP